MQDVAGPRTDRQSEDLFQGYTLGTGRIVDGAVGAAFSNAVIRRLQKPAAMMVSF